MFSSNTIILIGIALLAVVFYNLYNSVMKTESSGDGKNLQITPDEIFEQVESLVEKGNIEVAHQLAKKYLNENPSHDRLRVVLAKSLYKSGKYMDSVYHFEKLMRAFPDRDDLLELLAIAYHKVGQRTNAISSYLELLKLTPDSMDAKLSLAELYDETHQKKMSLNMYKKILEELTSENEKIRCLLQMAKICRDMANMEGAVHYAQNVLALKPDYPQALHLLKEFYKAMGRAADVIEIMNKLLVQSPDNSVMQLELVNFYYNSKQYDAAFELAKSALIVVGSDKVALNCIISKIYIETGKVEDAIATLNNVLSSYPNNAEIIEILTAAYIKSDNYESAIELYNRLIELSGIEEAKSHRNYLCNLYCDWAMSLYNSGKTHVAFEKLNLATEINPDNVCIYVNLGKIAFFAKDYGEAIKQFKRAVDIEPNSSEYYVYLGGVYLEMDDTYNAEKVFQEAIYIDPQNAAARCKLGIIRIKQRNVANAIEHLKLAVEQEPNNIEYLYNLALGYEFSDDREDALRTYERVLQINPNHIETINNIKIIKNSN